MAAHSLSQTEVRRLLEEGSSLSHNDALAAAQALSSAGVEIVEPSEYQPIDPDEIVKSLVAADIGIKDQGVIGGVGFQRNRL